MPTTGVLLQLVAKGEQDKFLTGNPQMTFCKVMYKRHTNFAIETAQMDIIGTPDFGKTVYFNIPRNGDLLGKMFIRVVLPPLTLDGTTTPVSYCNGIGHVLIEEISIEIGEKEIDKQYGEFMEIWSRLTTPESKRVCMDTMIGRTYSYDLNSYDDKPSIFPPPNGKVLYIPLQFWFCKNPGSALPLLSIPYTQIRIKVKFAPLSRVFWKETSGNVVPIDYCSTQAQVSQVHLPGVTMWGDYIYLDKEERVEFLSKESISYIIDQLQYSRKTTIDDKITSVSLPLEFNNPIKEFFIIVQRKAAVDAHEYFNFSNLTRQEYNKYASAPTQIPVPLNQIMNETNLRTDLISNAILYLDGQERNVIQDATYYRLLHTYGHHTSILPSNFIYTYSLSLSPEELQPSGSLNASRIDNMTWHFDMNEFIKSSIPPVTDYSYTRGECTLKIYALNYNILRIIDGYARVLFSV